MLTLGIASAFSLFAAATAAQKRAIDRSHAAAIAEQVLADVESALARGLSPESILEQPPLETVKENWPGYQVDLFFFAVPGELEGDLVLLRADVYWKVRGRERRESFEQLIVAQETVR